MNQQISEIKKEYQGIQSQLNAAGAVSDSRKMAELGKRQAELAEIMGIIADFEKIEKNMQENAEIINTEEDPELKQMAIDENIKLSEKKKKLEKNLERC